MSEQGHAKNLEHFRKARNFADGWGTKYTPTNELIFLTDFNIVIPAAETVMDELQAARTPYRNATAAAADRFDPLNELITRVMRALKISGVPDSVYQDAQTFARKIQGRAKTKQEDDPATPGVDESAHSVSQQSRAQRVEQLDALILLLASHAGFYKPNEDPLKIASLEALSVDLKAAVGAVEATFVPYSNKLVERDRIFYDPKTGIVARGRMFKDYTLAAYGRNSPEWTQIKGLEFKPYKRRG